MPAFPSAALPGVYLGSVAGAWYGPQVRPRVMLLSADWTVQKIRWADWSRLRADGRGHVVACQMAGGPCTRFWARIQVTRTREHDGARYFARMTVSHGAGQVILLVMDRRAGWWVRRPA